MSLQFFNWSRTASSNASADAAVNWAEGQAPSSVNDSARAMMASLAGYRDDIAGGITTGGTSTAYTVASFQVFDTLAHLAGQKIAFIAHATNTNAVGVDVTLNVDSLGAKPVRMAPSIALPNGTLVLGTPYIVSYNNVDGVHYLQNMTNPYAIPLAGGIDFWGTSTPNSSFAFPIGQALSRTTYATLFSIMGTTYGSGDGSTTFNIPDKTGRVSVMKEAVATRLTAAVSGIDGGTIGAAGGTQSHSILQANLPNVNFNVSGTFSGNTNTGTVVKATGALTSAVGGGAVIALPNGSSTVGDVSVSGTISGTAASGGSGTALPTAMPTIVANYIIRII